ncbi:OmpA/MotB family protein [Magnetofaba australis]|uniref:Putative OmpA/MotB domain-containing protein n=1 Tax=Magnetofaba australis IT-1 TaxID=1434232 RepID=A0A1Y2K384_9PROT|nr:flagellar motor protein MotB [Magnetofaba australis]OSM02481.1 putative OmpA/MotB domain-containing protein [Magnetofaba australis IT-1]
MAEKKKCPKCKKGAPGWMVTFGDLMSLLLTFFVLLLSFAQLDIVKFEKAKGSLTTAFGVQKLEQRNVSPNSPNLIAPMYKQPIVLVKLREQVASFMMRENVDMGDAETVEDNTGFSIQFKGEAMFEADGLTIRQNFQDLLRQIASTLAGDANGGGNLIRVVGHTDNTPPPGGAYPTNWALSMARAAAVTRFLAEQGIDPRRLQARGLGEFHPVADNNSSAGRQRNNRVEIQLSTQTLPRAMDNAMVEIIKPVE